MNRLQIVVTLSILICSQYTLQAETVTLTTPTGKLYGTMELPKTVNTGSLPIALIIAGSGPTDRDGNSSLLPGGNDSLKMLAEGLAKQGVASLRVDKRGIGESFSAGLPEEELRIETFITDAKAWLTKLKQDERFNTFFLIGHSEGALISYVVAQQEMVHGLVSVAGSGEPATTLIYSQLSSLCTENSCPDNYLKEIDKIIQGISQGKRININCKSEGMLFILFPSDLQLMFRPSVQPYLNSWFRYDPVEELKKVTAPVLIIQGTSDVQSSVHGSQKLLRANKNNTLIIIEDMNHVLKITAKERDQQTESYQSPQIPISPLLIEYITTFVNAKHAL